MFPNTRWLTLVVSLLISLVMFGTYFWPIHSRLTESIVTGDENLIPSSRPQPMKPGDQLQLMYHFWMFTDMLSGQTPWFYNLYEFNTGDDESRWELSTYYVPFSFFFAVGYWLSGYALGWNLSAFISIWLTVWLTYLFVQRYTRHSWQAWLCAAFAIALPYRWLNIAGGSPTGFSMAWVPLLMIGLDKLIHDRKISGGWLAGLAIFLSSLSDTHVFFFLVMATPAWMLFAFIYRIIIFRDPLQKKDILILVKGCISMSILIAVAYFLKQSIKDVIDSSSAAGGRNLSEVLLYTPWPRGLLSKNLLGVSEHIYIGFAVLILIMLTLLLGIALLIRGPSRPAAWRWMIVLLLAISGGVIVVLLALGSRGPWDGWVFITARELIPPYTMIRQTAKVFCLLPMILALIAALSFRLAGQYTGNARWTTWVMAIIMTAGLLEARTTIQPAMQNIDRKQEAYAAVTEDAALRKETPRLLVVTLWPGDSHITSMYQHFSSTYHIRMVNGYFPFVQKDYIDNVFKRLESVNMGLVSDEQIKWLRDRQIHYVIVHENIYFEKVSAFPIGYALWNFINHPNFELLKQDGPVWAFRLLDHPKQTTSLNEPLQWPSGRFQEAERFGGANNITIKDASARNNLLVRLNGPDQLIISGPWDYGPASSLQWGIRARGNGRLQVNRFVEKTPVGSLETTVASPDWEWIHVTIPQPETRRNAHFEIEWLSGEVDIDMVQLQAGNPIEIQPGDSWSIPAAHLFHSGYSTPDLQHVVYDPNQESPGTFLYGPKLPFPAGKYEFQVDFTTTATNGVTLGNITVDVPEGRQVFSREIQSGSAFLQELNLLDNLPLNMVVTMFDHNHPVTVNSVTLKRIE